MTQWSHIHAVYNHGFRIPAPTGSLKSSKVGADITLSGRPFREGLQLEHLWILKHRIQITQETPLESYYRQNLGRVRHAHTVDKTMEPSGDGGPIPTSQSFSNLQ